MGVCDLDVSTVPSVRHAEYRPPLAGNRVSFLVCALHVFRPICRAEYQPMAAGKGVLGDRCLRSCCTRWRPNSRSAAPRRYRRGTSGVSKIACVGFPDSLCTSLLSYVWDGCYCIGLWVWDSINCHVPGLKSGLFGCKPCIRCLLFLENTLNCVARTSRTRLAL